MLKQSKKSGDPSMFGMLVFVAVVFQPAVEELLFRGYFYGVFKGWAGAVASAIFTATLFAAIHGNVAALVPLLLFALGLTLAYEWSGSLLVPVAMHMTFNGVQLAVLTWAPQLLEKQ
jgi:membrane protease YdiL (CAAX protease family)